MKNLVVYLLAFMMLAGAVAHLAVPQFYAPLIPEFIPVALANILSTIVEGAIGIALLVPKYRKWGGLGFLLLMIAFLPLHIWDLTKSVPMVGSKGAAIFRLFMQFVLMYGGYWVWQKDWE